MIFVNNDILKSFFGDQRVSEIIEFGNGHINETYLLSLGSEKYILQKVNGNIFNTKNLIHNYTILNEYSSTITSGYKHFPDMLLNKNGDVHTLDLDGNAWRVTEFIDNCPNYSISPGLSITEKAGSTMGKFQCFLSKLDPHTFKDTISGFHNPKRRVADFDRAILGCEKSIMDSARDEIKIALNHKDIAENIEKLLVSNVLPNRITHNDTKLENILFDLNNNHTYVIDLDTVMKGSILFDFGDMVRSITSLAKEDEQDIDEVSFSIDHFNALSKGYFGEIKGIITKHESDNILDGLLCVIYIQGIRFLTDYLDGNNYYKTKYGNHNLIRCRTQFKLLTDIINSKIEVKKVIDCALKQKAANY